MGGPERMWGDDLGAQTQFQAHETVGSGRVELERDRRAREDWE